MSAEALILQTMTGLSRAAILFIVAVGLSLVFGAMRIVNIAHGSFYMIGAFVAVTVSGAIGGLLGFLAALVVVPLLVAAIGGLIEVTALRRLYGKEHLLQLLATFAFLLIASDAVRFLYGERPRSLRAPSFASGPLQVGGAFFPRYSIFLIVMAIVIGVGLWGLLTRTGLGRTIRAAVDDPEMLGMVGVNVPRLFTVVFALGAALAAAGGVLAGPQTTILLGMDVDFIIEAFAVVIIGGLGSLVGTAVGAVLVGVTFALGITVVPQGALASVFVVMVAVLVWRPYGLFGTADA
jgi:branched-subunit amino acid ABC-type transport system permease component